MSSRRLVIARNEPANDETDDRHQEPHSVPAHRQDDDGGGEGGNRLAAQESKTSHRRSSPGHSPSLFNSINSSNGGDGANEKDRASNGENAKKKKLSCDGGEGEAPVDGEEEEEDLSHRGRVPPLSVFKYADWLDITLMVIGFLMAMVGGAGMPAFSFALGRLVNDLLTKDPKKAAAESALIMVYIGVGISVACMAHVCCWCVAAVRQVMRLRASYFAAVLRQDIGWHDFHKPGELTARLTGDTRVVQNGINDRFSQGVLNMSMGVFGFIFGFVFCWELTLVMLGIMPFVAIAAAMMGNVLAKATSDTRKQFARAGSIATEVIENIRTVQVFGKQEQEVARFAAAVKLSEKPGRKRELMNSLSVGTTLFLIMLTYTVVFFFSGYLVKWGRTNVGDAVATFLAVLFGSMGIGFFFPSLTAFTESRAAALHLFETIDRVPPIDVDAGGVPVTGFYNDVEFRNVRFSYPTRADQILFTDLNLVIKKGQKVAFSGSSGCGKSSLIGLLQRFYDPTGGAVLVDGVDMRDLDLVQWRDQIGIVSQEPNLFAGSMLENVRVGKPDATEEEVVTACRRANIHDTIMSLPDKYNTRVGAVGSQLSGGQKQRIAIARALVKQPAVLLLDEATSALDRKSEVEVQAALDELMRQGSMTIIVIAHRLATIRGVDCIYYVSFDGVAGSVIAEQGSFDELMAREGMFAAMAKAQGTMSTGCKDSEEGGSGGGAAAGKNVRQRGQTEVADDDDDAEAEALAEVFAGNQILTSEQIAKLGVLVPPTERQQLPIEELATWEVKQTHVTPWRLLGLNRDKTWAILLGLLGSLVSGAIAPVNTILMGKMMNALAMYDVFRDEDAMMSEIKKYAPIFVAIAFAALGGWLLQFFYGYAGEHLTTTVRTTLFRQILRQDMSFFDIPGRDAGTLSGMLSGDCEAIHQLCGPAIGIRIQTACTILVGIIVGLCYQWKLALVATACVPLIVGAMLLEQKMMSGLNSHKAGDSDDTVVTEALSNVRTVTSFNLKDDRVHRFADILADERARRLRRHVFVGILYGCSQFVYYGSFSLCYYFGGSLMSKGEATFEQVNVASLSVLMGAMSAGEAGGFAAKVGDAKKASRRVFSVIDRVPDVDVLDRSRTEVVDAPACGSGCELQLRKALFIYPARPNQVVLASVDLDFAAGTVSGLMGQTGCGKSTIIQLLSCFYPHRRGRILVNGRALQRLDIRRWRHNISIVLQEPDLFSGTVRENICYSLRLERPPPTDDQDKKKKKKAGEEEEVDDDMRDPNPLDAPATDEEVIRAAKWAHIHDDIMAMPEGYNTHVGYKGRALSGGQKQRVAIARGLLRRHTRVLLLDEATSALDNATEAKVQVGLEDYLQHRREQDGVAVTVISIAHRLTTIRYSDQIVLLDGGRIIERGNHDELMALGGEYKTRWELYAAGSSM